MSVKSPPRIRTLVSIARSARLRGFVGCLRNSAAASRLLVAPFRVGLGSSQPIRPPSSPASKRKANWVSFESPARKDHAELYNLYSRTVGSPTWIFIGVSRKEFPFDGQRPLATPGIFEERHPRQGVADDQEVSIPIWIVSVKLS